MFSGKSTELIRRLKRYEVAQYKVLIVKYAMVRRCGICEYISQVSEFFKVSGGYGNCIVYSGTYIIIIIVRGTRVPTRTGS